MNTRVLANPFSRSVSVHLALLALALIFAVYAPPLKLLTPPEEITLEVIEPKKDSVAEKAERTKSVVKPSVGEEALVAKKDSYLSDKTRVVEQERSAKAPGESVALPGAPVMSMVPKPKTAAVDKPAKPIKMSDLGVKISHKKAAKFEEERNWAQSQTGENIRGGEYIQGMKEGENSALNTKEFVFYSYFDRVRKQLDQSWQPLLREQIQRIYKHGRHLASNTDFVTRTVVTLTSRGEVARVQLVEESGTTDLDQAAIDALNKAGPYPNPPKGLVDKSGEVQIRWDFILKT